MLLFLIILITLIYIDGKDIKNDRNSDSIYSNIINKSYNNRIRHLIENKNNNDNNIDTGTFEPSEEPSMSPTLIVYKTKSPNIYKTRPPSYEPTVATPTSYPLLFKPDGGEEPVAIDTDAITAEPSTEEYTRVPTENTDNVEPLAIGVILGVVVIAVGVALVIMLSANNTDKSNTSSTEETTSTTTGPETAPLLDNKA